MSTPALKIDIRRLAESLGRDAREVAAFVDTVRSSLIPLTKAICVTENAIQRDLHVTRRAVGPLITEAGEFWEMLFSVDDEWGTYEVVFGGTFDVETLMPRFDPDREIILRPDSGCSTGQRFLDLTCDCRHQLHLTMRRIAETGQGLIVHIPGQDGRGKGEDFKLATLWLQKHLEVDTVQSASILACGDSIDVRTYAGAVAIMKFLNVPSDSKLVIAANNPEKSRALAENGYLPARSMAVAVPPTPHTRRHLIAKKEILGHQGLLVGV